MPLWPDTTFIDVGSPTITADGFGVSRTISPIILGAPRQPISSSYENAKISGRFSGAASASSTCANANATKLFMSATPRP